mgnify:CR=1 FL=1
MNNLGSLSAIAFGLQAFVTLLVILDPPGVTPFFLALVGDRSPRERIRLAWQAASVSLFVIVLFTLFGKVVLNYLHVSLFGLQGAGGLLMLLISLELLTGKENPDMNPAKGNIALVPLGTPLLAGPGAIVTTMLYANYAHGAAKQSALLLAIIATHVIIAITLMFSTKVLGLVKESGITLFARIAGLLLAAIAVEMIVASVKGFFHL